MTATESKWSERVQEWKASGESAEDYARGRGFEASTLRWWSSRLGRGAAGTRSKIERSGRVRMVRVARVPASVPGDGSVTLHVGAVRVEVRRGFDRGLLREVVEALGGER